MANEKPSSTDTFQMNPDDLLSTYPQFYSAHQAISDAATSLHNALTTAATSWDGDAQKKLSTLGNAYVKNLQTLADAMNTVGDRLSRTANSTYVVEHNNVRSF